MTDLNRSLRRVRVALMLFGVPCAAALAALFFHSVVTSLIPVGPRPFQLLAAGTGLGTLGALVVGWRAARRALDGQAQRLRECSSELTLRRQELTAARTQHALEVKLKTQELEHAILMREDRIKILELEHALGKPAPAASSATRPAEPEPAAPVRRGPPLSLSRPRKILREADAAEDDAPAPAQAPDTE